MSKNKSKSKMMHYQRVHYHLSITTGERGKWNPIAPTGDTGQVFCPKKRGIIAEGRCIKWQRVNLCALDCGCAVTDPKLVWKANPSAYFIADPDGRLDFRGRVTYKKWEQLKALIQSNDGSINAYEAMNALEIASYEAAAMMLRYYEKKELLNKLDVKAVRPQRYVLSKAAKAEASTQPRKEKEGDNDTQAA